MGRLLICGERGQDTIDELRAQGNETTLDKPTYGAFASTRLDEILRAHGVEQLIFAGVTADVCVHTTLREAIDRGYDCWCACHTACLLSLWRHCSQLPRSEKHFILKRTACRSSALPRAIFL